MQAHRLSKVCALVDLSLGRRVLSGPRSAFTKRGTVSVGLTWNYPYYWYPWQRSQAAYFMNRWNFYELLAMMAYWV